MIIAIGDVHGKFDQHIRKMQDVLEGNTGVNFVQLGDFGLGFQRPLHDWNELKLLNDILINSSSNMYIIRGNHDNPAFWDDGCGFDFSNIHFVSNGTILQIEDKNCYFAGGAISVDRIRRRQGIDYWKAESFINTRAKVGDKIDILFTHDVYHPCSPFSIDRSDIVNHFASEDPYLLRDLKSSQLEMIGLYQKIIRTNPNFTWYHGHYHESHVTNNNEQITHSLSELEFKEVR